ncbi:MAG TPA: Bax inhibitor-1/YccA family protein [Gemmatimonadales bacterium]|nr:Bax inhibitor-1/YccA family protein [Gemmatimonadales bacterium]
MALMRTSNPALNARTFADLRRDPTAPPMMLEGTVNKAALLLFLVVVPAAWVWTQVRTALDPAVVGPWILLGVVGGFIAAIATILKKEWAPVTAPVYAALEGLAIGGLSALLETKYPGIVMQSVGLTFATLAAMLVAYRTGLIKATEKFKLGVFAATGAIALYYVVGWVLSLFHVAMPFLQGNSTASLVVSGVIVVVAALNLILDFDFIETGVAAGAPKYMESYGAFGLMVTLIWLYLEILRLLAKSRSRR